MNIVKFIKQIQYLDADDLKILIAALRTKYYAAKSGSMEEANIKAQMDAARGLLSKKAPSPYPW